MPRKYLVAIIRAWWFPLVMGVVLGTITVTWSITETLMAMDSFVCALPADVNVTARSELIGE